MPSNQPPDTLQKLKNHCASQAINLQFCRWPKIRFELVNGRFLVGGSVEGSRGLLKEEALLGWGLEAAMRRSGRSLEFGQRLLSRCRY